MRQGSCRAPRRPEVYVAELSSRRPARAWLKSERSEEGRTPGRVVQVGRHAGEGLLGCPGAGVHFSTLLAPGVGGVVPPRVSLNHAQG